MQGVYRACEMEHKQHASRWLSWPYVSLCHSASEPREITVPPRWGLARNRHRTGQREGRNGTIEMVEDLLEPSERHGSTLVSILPCVYGRTQGETIGPLAVCSSAHFCVLFHVSVGNGLAAWFERPHLVTENNRPSVQNRNNSSEIKLSAQIGAKSKKYL